MNKILKQYYLLLDLVSSIGQYRMRYIKHSHYGFKATWAFQGESSNHFTYFTEIKPVIVES